MNKKIVIYQNNTEFSNWNKRLSDICSFFSKASIELEFKVKNTFFKEIPFVEMFANGKKAKRIEPMWFYENICKTAKESGFDGVIFFTDKKQWKGFPVEALQTNILSNFIEIQGGFDEKDSYNFEGVDYSGDKATHLIKHELSHEFYQINGKQDLTHFRYLTKTVDAIIDDIRPKGALETAFDAILRLLKKDSPTVILKRKSDNGKQTIGTLIFLNGKKLFECKTLELPYLDNKQNISCIPLGEYNCELRYSNRFKKNLYEIKDVKNRTGILFHGGNFYNDTDGCILLGSELKDLNGDGNVDVLSSQATVNEFMDIADGKPFKLLIM